MGFVTVSHWTASEMSDEMIQSLYQRQLKVSIDFLKGLVKSFGLKGDVEGVLEDENLVVKVTGEQTEALVVGTRPLTTLSPFLRL